MLQAGRELPRAFWLFAAAAGLTTAGLVTFGVISYHLVAAHLVGAAAVPLVYAAAMAAEAVAAFGSGWVHDRWGARGLLVLPVLVAAVPRAGFTQAFGLALVGVLIWGAATGLQDSTVKALVAQLVPAGRRATGVRAVRRRAGGGRGGRRRAGGSVGGHPRGRLAWCVAGLQTTSLLLLRRTLRGHGEASAMSLPSMR